MWLCGCCSVPQLKTDVLFEFTDDRLADLYRPIIMPVSACSDGYVIVSSDQIYKITGDDFKNPKLLCDARKPGWEAAVRHMDGANALAHVTSVFCDPNDKIYFGDGQVKEVMGNGGYRVVAGTEEEGYVDSSDGGQPRFGNRIWICGRKGRIVVSDTFNNALREVHPETGEVKTLFGRKKESPCWNMKNDSMVDIDPASADGSFDVASLRDPLFVLCDIEGRIIIVCNEIAFCEYTVRLVDIDNRTVSTLAGKTYSKPERKDGPSGVSRLEITESATIDDKGNIYIATLNYIRKINKAGITSTIHANYLKNGECGYIHTVIFDKRADALIYFDHEGVKRVRLHN